MLSSTTQSPTGRKVHGNIAVKHPPATTGTNTGHRVVPAIRSLPFRVPISRSLLRLILCPFTAVYHDNSLAWSSNVVGKGRTYTAAGQAAAEACLEKHGPWLCGAGGRKRWTGGRSRTLAPPRGAAWIVDRFTSGFVTVVSSGS